MKRKRTAEEEKKSQARRRDQIVNSQLDFCFLELEGIGDEIGTWLQESGNELKGHQLTIHPNNLVSSTQSIQGVIPGEKHIIFW